MNIIVDKSIKGLADLIDNKYHVYEIDIASLVECMDGDLGMAVEEVYVKCVDKNVELVIAGAGICDRLEVLGIKTIRK